MVGVKICRRSLAAFSSFTDGHPTDKVLEKKAFKETSPPSQSHAYIKIYECEDCCNGNCTTNDDTHKRLKKIMTEVVSSGVQTSVIYKDNDTDEVLFTFVCAKPMQEIEDHIHTLAMDMEKYNAYTNSCICYVRDLCNFLDPDNPTLPDTLKELQDFMEKLSKREGWRKLWIRFVLLVVLPISAIFLTYIYY